MRSKSFQLYRDVISTKSLRQFCAQWWICTNYIIRIYFLYLTNGKSQFSVVSKSQLNCRLCKGFWQWTWTIWQFYFDSIIICLSFKSQPQLIHSIYCIFLTLISSLISKSFWQPVAGKATLIFMLYQITLSERMKST